LVLASTRVVIGTGYTAVTGLAVPVSTSVVDDVVLAKEMLAVGAACLRQMGL